jgi:hypothetical protein
MFAIRSHTTIYIESGLILLATPMDLCPTLFQCIACISLPYCSLLDWQPFQAGLSVSKLPQPMVYLIDIAAPSSVSSLSLYLHIQTGSAQKPETFHWLNRRGII